MPGRADLYLVAHGFAASRAEAQAAIEAGQVTADGKPVLKASQPVKEGAAIVYAKAHPYVSRGALKLAAALDHFKLSPAGLTCLDLGASTGGFTEVLLERGARKVFAVDVGHGQLHAKLAADPRVISLERCNARDLDPSQVTGRMQVLVADVSFINLKLALPRALALTTENAWLVALVKPQFEAGKEHIGKKGIVRSDYDRWTAAVAVAQWLYHECEWNILGVIDSPIPGGDGNREFLLAARRDGPRHFLVEYA